jgi:hypothetical protein
MIQRIQTVFLFLVVVAMGVAIGFPMWLQSAQVAESQETWSLTAFTLTNLNSTGEIIQTSSKWYIGALVIVSGLLALVSIFQFANRGRQMMINMINSLLMVALVSVIFLTTSGVNKEIAAGSNGAYQIGFWAILAAKVFNMLANRFIRKDELLVRSVDRIR